MDHDTLRIEIDLIRTQKRLADEARLAHPELAKRLRMITNKAETSEDDQWKKLQIRAYKQLQYVHSIMDNYEERKTQLIKPYFKESDTVVFDSRDSVKFDKRANVLIITSGDEEPEVL